METIERAVTLPTDPAAAWDLLTRPDLLAGWLGREVDLDPTPGATGRVVDDDGTARSMITDAVDVGRRLAWTWTDDQDRVSRVEITLAPADTGTTVRVVEQLLPHAATDGARACASGEAWSHRLLHLEALLLIAAAVRG